MAQVDGGYDEENEELELDDLGLDTFPAVNTTLSADDFENLSAFEDGDYVLITAVGDEVKTIQAAEVVSGTVTSYTSNKNVTLDGTKYEYSQGYSSTYNLKDDYDLVLDTYGYVIYADGVEASNDYVFITNVAQIGGVNKSFEAKPTSWTAPPLSSRFLTPMTLSGRAPTRPRTPGSPMTRRTTAPMSWAS